MAKNELLAIDPGADQGFAVLEISSGTLLSCGLGSPEREDYEALIIEKPQIYRHSKADPADIVKLSIRAGIQINRFRESPAYLVTPHTWKGDVPKNVHAGRIIGRLTPYEVEVLGKIKAPAGKRHNVIDAVGLGKWFLDNRGMWPMLLWK